MSHDEDQATKKKILRFQQVMAYLGILLIMLIIIVGASFVSSMLRAQQSHDAEKAACWPEDFKFEHAGTCYCATKKVPCP